jgi:hypothetical protein
MTSSTTALRGVVHGKIIELDEEVGLPDGQAVTVSVQPVGRRLPPEKAFADPPVLGRITPKSWTSTWSGTANNGRSAARLSRSSREFSN